MALKGSSDFVMQNSLEIFYRHTHCIQDNMSSPVQSCDNNDLDRFSDCT